jgi:hypothetical protein
MHGYDYNHSLMLYNALLEVPSLEETTQQYLRGEIGRDTLIFNLWRNGVSLERADTIEKLLWRFLDMETALKLYWRGKIELEEFLRIGRYHGYTPQNLALWSMAQEYYPAPEDVVRFAVREVYNPTIRTLYGLDEDLTTDYLDMARKVGLSETFARDYWASHWILPSVEMGFEMFHREVINRDELITLLRTQDIMPYWRDKLIQISYALVTRVDARRMLEVGVWSPEQFFRHMLHLGYSPEDARDITAWAVQEYVEENRELTKSDIKKALVNGDITTETALSMLKDLGYPDFNAELILNDWLRETLKEWIDATIEYWSYLFVRGRIDLTTLRGKFGELPISSTRLEKEVLKAQLEKDRRVKSPSKEDIIKWFNNKQIGYDTAFEMLREIGYSDFHAFLYLGGKEEKWGTE